MLAGATYSHRLVLEEHSAKRSFGIICKLTTCDEIPEYQVSAARFTRYWHAGYQYFRIGLLLFVCVSSLCFTPWLTFRRFSLRTLLIATTLVAVVLGVIVAVLRWPAG